MLPAHYIPSEAFLAYSVVARVIRGLQVNYIHTPSYRGRYTAVRTAPQQEQKKSNLSF